MLQHTDKQISGELSRSPARVRMVAIFLVSSGMFVMGYVLFECFFLFNTDFFFRVLGRYA